MAKETNRLDELEELGQTDRISPLDINEPELIDFDASSIFQVREEDKAKRTLFGKRSQKAAAVTINPEAFDTEPEPEPEPEKEKKNPREEQSVFSEHPDIAPAVTELKTAPEETEEDEVEEAVEVEEEEAVAEAEEEDEDEYYNDDELELYEDKKRFLLSQYPMIEDYLSEQSQDGYHYVRHVGKKYYFQAGDPENYYYSICYFRTEPEPEDWRAWEKSGWKLISRQPGKNRKEAGWFTFRHKDVEGEYRKTIDNEAEKYRFFRKYANSCRSTMFLLFICMAILAVTAFMQYRLNGYLWVLLVCVALFVVCLVAMLQYNRMLRFAKKRARMLQSKLRIQEAQQKRIRDEDYDTSETEAQLESDWDTLGR